MKTTTLKNKLDRNFTGSKNSKSYRAILDIIEKTNSSYLVFGNIIRPCTTSGRGRFTTNLDYTNDIVSILKDLNIKFEVGNDAPRGGLTGNYIKILTKIQ